MKPTSEKAKSASKVSSRSHLGERVPRLRFPGFEGEWNLISLGKECTCFSGGTPDSTNKELYGGTIPFIRSAEIDEVGTQLFLTDEGLEQSSAKEVQVGDLLLAMYGANSGEVAISKINGAINQAILCIRSNSLDTHFLKYFLERDKERIINRYLQGGQGNLSAEIIKELRFPFPALITQHKISHFLELVDNRIAAQRRLVELLKKHKRGVIEQIFTDSAERMPKLRFSEFDNGWQEKQLGDIGTFNKGAPLSKADIAETGHLLVLYGELYTTYGEVINHVERRTTRNVAKSYLSKKGDVIIPTSGETAEEIATASCVMVDGVILGGDLNIFRSSKVDGRFLAYLMRHKVSWKISRIAQGVSVVHISASELKHIHIAFPTQDEQERIVSLLSLLDSRIAAAQATLDKCINMRRGLLQQLFV